MVHIDIMTELPGQIANMIVENYCSGSEKQVGWNYCYLCYFTFPEVVVIPRLFWFVTEMGSCGLGSPFGQVVNF